MTFKFSNAIAVMAALSLSSCATMFSSKWQKVTFTSKTPGATILYRGDSLGAGTTTAIMDKNLDFHTVRVEKKGFESRNYAFEIKKKKSGSAAWALLEVPFLLAPPLGVLLLIDLQTPKVHRFDRNHIIPEMTPVVNKTPEEKYLLVDNVALNAASKDINVYSYSRLSTYLKKPGDQSDNKKGKQKKGKEDINVSNTIFSDELNNTLTERGFVDTNNKLFSNVSNSLYMDATIKKVTIHRISRNREPLQMALPNELVAVQTEIEWKILDYYKQPVCTVSTQKTSDLYLVHIRDMSLKDQEHMPIEQYGYKYPTRNAIANNLTLSMADVRAELNKKGVLKVSSGDVDTSAVISLARPVAPGETARLNQMLQSSVSVKVDEGHGSGVIISEDGYILTNYHVIVGSKKVEIVFNNDSTAKATVVRTSPDADLALLKIEKTGLFPLPLSEAKEPEVGADAWAIGTPRSLELGQTLSKGIVSGVRNANGYSYIQSDAKVSPGNSGGALINRKGEVLGIVSSKLIGGGAEGVSFAISAFHALAKLNIHYKQ